MRFIVFLAAATLSAQTPTPDRVILTYPADPATSMAVTWRTDPSVTKALAQIAVAEDGPLFVKKTTDVAAVSTPLTVDNVAAHYHSVRFTALKPDTLYTYRVGDGKVFSEWHQFRTAKATAAPLTFLYVGDAQNDILQHWSRLIRMAYAQAPDAKFIVHAGDLINRGAADAEWGEWHQSPGWINATMPSFPSPGNHEYSGVTPRGITPHWRAQFTLPENGAAGLEEQCYWMDVQGVRMISLNSNEKHAEQAQWLDQLLSDPARPQWTILTFHHPIYSSAKGRDNKELRALWQPIFDKHKVDLVMQGHDHTYARSNLTSGTNTKAGGTVYVVSVSGPKMYNLVREPWMQRAAEDTQLFQVIRVDGGKLTYESRTARGELYDAFELVKRKGKTNLLVNRMPKVPENLRTVAPAASQ